MKAKIERVLAQAKDEGIIHPDSLLADAPDGQPLVKAYFTHEQKLLSWATFINVYLDKEKFEQNSKSKHSFFFTGDEGALLAYFRQQRECFDKLIASMKFMENPEHQGYFIRKIAGYIKEKNFLKLRMGDPPFHVLFYQAWDRRNAYFSNFSIIILSVAAPHEIKIWVDWEQPSWPMRRYTYFVQCAPDGSVPVEIVREETLRELKGAIRMHFRDREDHKQGLKKEYGGDDLGSAAKQQPYQPGSDNAQVENAA